jgi:basic membrane protein A
MLLALIMLVSMAGCGGKTEDPQAAEDTLKVVYLVNGNLGDKGFFDSAASGLEMMKNELGAEIKCIEMGRDETTYEGNFLDVSEQDWDVIVGGTWSVQELMQEIAVQFPEKDYLFFDGAINRDIVTTGNAMGISYKAVEGSFMAGVLAAKMFESGDANIDPNNKVVGFVGSMDGVNINEFLIGYIEGIKFVDPEIKVMTSYVGSYEDVPKCLEMTTQLYNQGAQIVYAPASQSILGAATAAQNAGKYLIACDQDLYSQLAESDPEMAKWVLSSSLKKVGDSLLTAVKGMQDGTMSASENYTLGLDSGAVGLAKNANYEALVPEAIRAEIDEIEAKVIAGEIPMSNVYEMATEEIAAIRDSMKP